MQAIQITPSTLTTPPMRENPLVESLLKYIDQLALSKSVLTVEAYWYDIAKWIEYLADRKLTRPGSLKADHVISYLSYSRSTGKSESTINRYYQSIRSFCKWLRREKLQAEDITQDIPAPMHKQIMISVPSVEDIQRLLDQPNTATESGVRDRAMLELLYSSGLRASEICDMELSDLYDEHVRVACGKRGRTRSVPINDSAKHWIARYVDEYRGREQGYLFITLMGKQVRRQVLSANVREYADKAGLREVTTHTLRHACATHLLEQGADIRMIQEVLGHSSISSTQRYTQLSTQRIKSMFRQFHPRRLENAS